MKNKKQNMSALRQLVEKRNRYRRFDWWLLGFISIIITALVVIISL
ncbi:MAG: hypothetical protein ABIX01_19575 [Chitinophagaceae bacterium]